MMSDNYQPDAVYNEETGKYMAEIWQGDNNISRWGAFELRWNAIQAAVKEIKRRRKKDQQKGKENVTAISTFGK